MTVLLYPKAAARIVPFPTPGAFQSLGLILHVAQGNNSLYGWFSNPNNQAVSHWWVSKTGVVEQYLDAESKSWAQMQGNATYHSVETEGYATESLTPQQVSALAGLYRWGHDTFGWAYQLSETPGVRGFGWHGMGGAQWGGHYGCPGDLRKAQRQAILDAARPKETRMVLVRDPQTGREYLQDDAGLHYLSKPASVASYQGAGVPGPDNVDPADLKSFTGYVA